MAKNVKLGKKASSFFDAVTRLKVVPGQVAEVTDAQAKSEKFRTAISGRWLVETDEPVTGSEEAEAAANKDKPKNLGDLTNDGLGHSAKTKDQLIAYIKDNYELEDEEWKKVNKLNKEDLVKYAETLDEEDEEEEDE